MKKPYQKPKLYAETFALVEHIAACTPSSNKVTYRENNQSCIYTADDGTILFYAEGGACGVEYLAFAEQYNGWNDYFDSIMNKTVCYTVLRDVGTPFSS